MSISRTTFIDMEERMIADMLEETRKWKELLSEQKPKQRILTYQEKKLLLLELRDIEDIIITEGAGQVRIDFHFRPIDLFLDNGSYNQDVLDHMEEGKKPFYHLWRVGFINFRTSKSVVSLNIVPTSHRLISFSSRYEDERKTNPHDRRMNCWGGWYATIENLFKEKKFFDAIIHLASRMKQITIADGAASVDKLREFNYERRNTVFLNDQEVEYFITSINWLKNAVPTRIEDDFNSSRNFVKCADNNNYYLAINFRGDVFRLEISPESYSRFFSR